MSPSTNKMTKKKKSLISRLRNKYRLVVLNDETFEEKISMRLSRLNVFVSATFGIVFLILFTTILIAFTPLKEYIPGYASTSLRKQVIELVNKTDSLEALAKIIGQHQYILKSIMNGEVPEGIADEGSVTEDGYEIEAYLDLSPEDKAFRDKVEEDERFNFGTRELDRNTLKSTLFFKPIEGMVSASFSYATKHFGTDIASKKNAAILAILEGTVLEAGWNPQTGNVIVIQHKNNMISSYKHNSLLLKESGDKVEAGEAIGVVGNTGTLSTDIHLHLELWINGSPVDPEHYIHF
ncbi:MAG: murein DD-endopeptidase MepM/ murein hydrolase activator NlpD [Candidatus Azotimanducaceae bacterium]